MSAPRAEEIHARLAGSWPAILASLGIAESALRLKKSGPCPACGGTDRYTFDDRRGRGDYICRHCGPGDGFALLARVHGWTFSEARQRVMEAAGLESGGSRAPIPAATVATPATPSPAIPSARVRWLMRTSCDIPRCPDAMAYLASRHLLPIPAGCQLRAHRAVEYYEGRESIGRYPALIAPVTDLAGALVTVHVTFLQDGAKLTGRTARKLLGPLTGREGCAVRLAEADDVLGIAEGIETALAAMRLYGIPTWSALSAPVLEHFTPPASVRHLIIYCDRDKPGIVACRKLTDRLARRLTVERRLPPEGMSDFADVLASQNTERSSVLTPCSHASDTPQERSPC